jgi:hypothetical protein
MEELDLVMRIQSQHTNVGCLLAILSRSQVTWVVNLHYGCSPICKVYIRPYSLSHPIAMT